MATLPTPTHSRSGSEASLSAKYSGNKPSPSTSGHGTRRKSVKHRPEPDKQEPPEGLSPRSGSPVVRQPLKVPQARRHSSVAYNIKEAARDVRESILFPESDIAPPSAVDEPMTWKTWVPLMFIVLPPTAGLLFSDAGSAWVTDILLLSVTAVFLHWAITSPWKWYISSHSIREEQEAIYEAAFCSSQVHTHQARESPSDDAASLAAERKEQARIAAEALKRLRSYELTALALCFLSPLICAAGLSFIVSLLSTFHNQTFKIITRDNLILFVLASEVKPVAHSIRLVFAHTAHLQRVAHSNPLRTVKLTEARFNEMCTEMERLRQRVRERDDALATVEQRLEAKVRAQVASSIQGEIEGLRKAQRQCEVEARKQVEEMRRRLRIEEGGGEGQGWKDPGSMAALTPLAVVLWPVNWWMRAAGLPVRLSLRAAEAAWHRVAQS